MALLDQIILTTPTCVYLTGGNCPHHTEPYPEETGSCTDLGGKRRNVINAGGKIQQNSKVLQRVLMLISWFVSKANPMLLGLPVAMACLFGGWKLQPFEDTICLSEKNESGRHEICQVACFQCERSRLRREKVHPGWEQRHSNCLSPSQMRNFQHMRWIANKGEKNTLGNRVNPFNE